MSSRPSTGLGSPCHNHCQALERASVHFSEAEKPAKSTNAWKGPRCIFQRPKNASRPFPTSYCPELIVPRTSKINLPNAWGGPRCIFQRPKNAPSPFPHDPAESPCKPQDKLGSHKYEFQTQHRSRKSMPQPLPGLGKGLGAFFRGRKTHPDHPRPATAQN